MVLTDWRRRVVAEGSGVPLDGRTETAPDTELSGTMALLVAVLGQPDGGTAAIPGGRNTCVAVA